MWTDRVGVSEGATTLGRMAATLAPDQLTAANRVITSLAGEGAALRDDQLRAVTALAGRPADPTERGARVLVVQATGWGKSAV